MSEFQSRNRETFDSNTNLAHTPATGPVGFQSRNRETFDSNNPLRTRQSQQFNRFNLVIEKLLIPTDARKIGVRNLPTRFNLVIEKLLIPTA